MSNPQQIIARGFKDEPSALFAHELQPSQRYVNVHKDSDNPPVIGWPVADAFDYDAEVFDQLQAAWAANDAIRLAELYRELGERPKKFVETLSAAGKEAK